jgi:pimeloyl-ACP methyl ester carboxylesterase
MAPTLLIPGLLCTPAFYERQLPALRRHGPVTLANHTAHASMADIARAILSGAPPRFCLAGHSMGGYIAFEILRQAPQRVARLALLSTAATPETPELSERRRGLIALAQGGKFDRIAPTLFPLQVHESLRQDAALLEAVAAMARDTGPEAFVRQQTAIMGRADSRPTLAAIGCPTLVLVGEADQITPPERAREIAAGIKGSELVVLEGCGHMCAMEKPQQVEDALVRWLRA